MKLDIDQLIYKIIYTESEISKLQGQLEDYRSALPEHICGKCVGGFKSMEQMCKENCYCNSKRMDKPK